MTDPVGEGDGAPGADAAGIVLPHYGALLETTRVMLKESSNTDMRFRDEGLYQSAYARPQNVIAYGGDGVSVFAAAASLTYGIATNHPLVDGNKRSAAIALGVTLLLNGVRLDVSQREFEETILAVARGDFKEADIERWAEANAVPDARFKRG